MNRTFFRFALALFLVPLIFCLSGTRSSERDFVVRSKFPLDNEERRSIREAKLKSGSAENSDNVKRYRHRRSPCDTQITCISTNPYRTIDGTCNNLAHSYWGSSNRPYNRFLPPNYEGFNSPRGTDRSFPLPKSRVISVKMTNTIVSSSPDDVTLMFMQWGQFSDHDLVITTNEAGPGSIYGNVPCCADFMDSTRKSPPCLPIDVTGDPFYSSLGLQCLPFVRSSQSFCIWPPEQINEQTAYLDASQVYGPNAAVASNVRESNSWRLKSGPGNENCSASPAPCLFDFLPVQNDTNGTEHFFAGDERVEEQPALTSIHTLLVRMHNHLGLILRSKHSNYSDDKVYEETRKIVIAVIQQITFNEFLPLILGNALMNQYNLTLRNPNTTDPYFYGYNASVDATIANVFPTAAYRFGHSQIADTFNMPDGSSVNLAHSFNNHLRTTIPGTFPSHFLRGISADPAQKMDHILTSAVQNFLLAVTPFTFGSDLYARNIERGRDHGLAPYIEWVNTCRGLPRAISQFSDLYLLMPNETVAAFIELYGDTRIREIDLFPAGIAEKRISGGLIGPTFACIISEMFYRLKIGDRHWFENPNVFTKPQLKSIRNTKLSTLICKFTDAPQLQENVMKIISGSNPPKPCDQLRQRGIIGDISMNW